MSLHWRNSNATGGKGGRGRMWFGIVAMFLGSMLLSHWFQKGAHIGLSGFSGFAPPAIAAAPTGPVRVAFSPGSGGDTAEHLVLAEIGKAQKQILVAAYEFTSAPIAKALLEAKRRGVDVQVVLDRTQATQNYSAARFLANEGIPVRIDYVPAILHDKFLCIDGHTVETGSFNFTRAAAERNAENAVAIDDVDLVHVFAQEWVRLWNEGTPYAAPGS